MKKKIIAIFLLLHVITSQAQNFEIKVFVMTDTSFSKVFSLEVENYQNMALNNQFVLVADSNAIFNEYDFLNGENSMSKPFRHKWIIRSEKRIADVCYVQNFNDIVIAYWSGYVYQYFKSSGRKIFLGNWAETFYKIKSDPSGNYIYYCSAQKYCPGGVFNKISLSNDNKKLYFLPRDSKLTQEQMKNIKPYEGNSNYQILNFDYNNSETLVAFLTENNDLYIINKDNNIRYNYNDETKVKGFKFISADSLIIGMDNGGIILGKYSELDFNQPTLIADEKIKNIFFVNKYNQVCIFYDKKIIIYKLKEGSLIFEKVIQFDNKIVDVKQYENNFAVIFDI
jgi:hypothetical protein